MSDGRVSEEILKNHINKFRNKYPTHPHLAESIEILTHPDHNLRHANFGEYRELSENYHYDPVNQTYVQKGINSDVPL